MYVNPKGNHHHDDKKKKKKGGLGKSQMIQESEEEEYQNITKKMKENERKGRDCKVDVVSDKRWTQLGVVATVEDILADSVPEVVR